MVSIQNTNIIRDRLDTIQTKMGLKEKNSTYFNVCIASEKGCVIESIAEPEKIGIINHASKNACETFGIPV